MKKRVYSWKRQLPDFRDYPYSDPIMTSFPALVDMESQGPPAYDQTTLGSCTANAGAAAYQFDLPKLGLPNFTPSRLQLYYAERQLDGDVKVDGGSTLRTTAKALATVGVCSEALWPYMVTKFKLKPNAAAMKNAALHKAKTYEYLDNTVLAHSLRP